MPNYRGVNGYGWKLRETLADWGGLALFHHAATELGVEAELVVYPGAGHGISKGTHRVDIQARVLDWFDRHLK